MGYKNNTQRIHRGILLMQTDKIRCAMHMILEKDSLNEKDTQAIRVLTEVYDVLSNPEKEMHKLYQGDCKTHYLQVSQDK